MARVDKVYREVLHEGLTGPIMELVTTPTVVVHVGKMSKEYLQMYKEEVEDIDALCTQVDDLVEKLLALDTLKEQPEVLDGKMFTPAKQRPAKRQAESSARLKPAGKTRAKKVKEETSQGTTNSTTDSQRPIRVLRSNTRTNIHTSTASSSYNSTANTVIEVSGYGKATKTSRSKAVTTPIRKTPLTKTPVNRTPVRSNSKPPTGDVKLTPLQKKNQREEEKRQNLLKKIEEKDKRIENKQAEKKKIDMLRKAQAELNKTPISFRGLRTPVGQKQMPMSKKNLNITPMAGSSNSSVSSYKSQPARLYNSVTNKALNDTPSTKATPLSNSMAKKAQPVKPPRSVPTKGTKAVTTKAKPGPASKAAKVEAPVVERHVGQSVVSASQIKPSIPKNDQPVIMELSPIRSDNTVVNIPVDISLINPVLNFDDIDGFNMQDNKNNIASTFLEETVFPHVAFAGAPEPTPKKTVQIDATFDVESTKENNYEITQYINDSQADPEQEYRNGKKIPAWARGKTFRNALEAQVTNGGDWVVDWPPMELSIAKEAFEGVSADSYVLKRLENRDESLAWNSQFL